MEKVNHPLHYRQHPAGVECITVIRHYVCDIANVFKYIWRAGLKEEKGMTMKEKELEDCMKALWYLTDFKQNRPKGHFCHSLPYIHPCGVACEDVAACYCKDIAQTFRSLWFVGLIVNGHVIRTNDEDKRIMWAEESLRSHIAHLKES